MYYHITFGQQNIIYAIICIVENYKFSAVF